MFSVIFELLPRQEIGAATNRSRATVALAEQNKAGIKPPVLPRFGEAALF
jgi:hypothetical protein